MTFGTLLSSQGTDASFGTSPEAPPGASLRCFRLYQSDSDGLKSVLRSDRNSEWSAGVLRLTAGTG
ncbi:hypothetical protein CUT44_21795 [Streptomyces carminius]|uniref:Uncharacterized protein n=1 Tax=Streptomyces carminius TaxID=2665496 RepID=A0A2M8LUG8_9ACTN|nr:hypothetical protein CUT44_21795 [Streptomyces carminius]